MLIQDLGPKAGVGEQAFLMMGSFFRARPSTRPISSGVGVRPSSSVKRLLARRHFESSSTM